MPARLSDHLTEVLVGRVQDAIFDLILDGVERPDVVAGDADFARLVCRIERDSVDVDALPLGAGVDPGQVPVEDDDLGVDLVGHRDDDHVVVVQAREVEIDDDLGLGLRRRGGTGSGRGLGSPLAGSSRSSAGRVGRGDARAGGREPVGIMGGVHEGGGCLVVIRVEVHALAIDYRIAAALRQLCDIMHFLGDQACLLEVIH